MQARVHIVYAPQYREGQPQVRFDLDYTPSIVLLVSCKCWLLFQLALAKKALFIPSSTPADKMLSRAMILHQAISQLQRIS